MTSFEGFLAHRYLHATGRGSFIKLMRQLATGGIALGVSAMLVCMALMNGFHDEIQKNIFSATAHFAVAPRLGDIQDLPRVLGEIRNTPGVVGASPMRMEKGLLRVADRDLPPEPLIIKGIDPASAEMTSTIFSSLEPYSISRLEEGEIVIGQQLAERLGLTVGSEISVAYFRLSLGPTGSQPKVAAYRIAGIFRSDIGEFDRSWAFIHLNDAMRLARTQQAEMIDVRTRSTDDITDIKSAVLKKIGGQFVASDLRDTNRALFSALRVEKWLFTSLIGVIVCIAVFNIVASLILLVTEKKRDLGVLLALGATPKQIEGAFARQGLHMGLRGTAGGLLFALPFCYLADRYRWIPLPSAVYDFITYVPFRLHVTDILIAILFPLSVSWLASKYPARVAARLHPIDSMRSS
ncbi:MAG: ABC transporter permease [Holophagaceae bacterium]